VAAARAGLKRVMLPARNRKDYDDIPEEARRDLEFVWLERVDDAVAAALEAVPTGQAAPEGPDTRPEGRARRAGATKAA